MQKIHGLKTEKINSLVLKLALGAALLAAVPLRTVQLFTNIEPNTGFFEANDWTVAVMYTVLVLAALVLVLLPVFSAKLPASRPVVQQNRGLALAAFVFAAGLAYDVIFTVLKAANVISAASGTAFTLLFTEGVFAMLLQALCGAAACVYMVMFALSYVNGNAHFSEYKLPAIMPLFWALFRIVGRFMTKISFTMVSELLMELAMLAFMLLFLLSFARVSAQVGQKGEMQKAIRYGLPAAFFALLIGITRLICTVAGCSELLADGFAFSLGDLGFGIFTVVYIFTHMRYGRPASEDEMLSDDAEETDSDETPSDEKSSDETPLAQ